MNSAIPHYQIYSDGACDPNPGKGGWAAIILQDEQEKILTGGNPETTNNRMELEAAIQALASLPQRSQVDLFTDSQYLHKGITEWLEKWVRKGWRTTSGKVANQDQWEKLLVLSKRHQVSWHWLKGHATDYQNNRADQFARMASHEKSGPS